MSTGTILISLMVALIISGLGTAMYRRGYLARGAGAGAALNPWLAYVMPIIGIGFALLFFSWIFPPLATAYVAWGGPVWMVVFGMAFIMAALRTIPSNQKNLRMVAILPVALVLATGTLWHLIVLAPFYTPTCEADDSKCEEYVATEEAKILEAEVAKAERRAVIAAAAERARATSPSCPGIYTMESYLGYKVINPKTCQVRWWVETGCVRWFDSNGNDLGKTCAGAEKNLVGQYALESIGGSATVSITLCEPGTTGNLLERCS